MWWRGSGPNRGCRCGGRERRGGGDVVVVVVVVVVGRMWRRSPGWSGREVSVAVRSEQQAVLGVLTLAVEEAGRRARDRGFGRWGVEEEERRP